MATVKPYTDPTKAWGMCLITACEFSNQRGWGLVQVNGLTYPRREHWASIQFDEELTQTSVVDLTMRQFDAERPARWEGTLDDWLDDMTECLVDNVTYAVYRSHDDQEDPVYTDFWIREDIEPGEMKEPWRV